MALRSQRRRQRRAAWKLAANVHRLLGARAGQIPSTTLPDHAWDELRRAAGRLRYAQIHQWRTAIGRAERRYEQARTDVVRQLEYLALRPPERPMRIPSLADVARDVAALQQEFSAVSLVGDELVVLTDPVELDGIRLGEFEVRLELGNARRDLPLRVIAVDPRPARSNDAVVHPHVSDERLCAGDGQAPLQRAFIDGRLFDLFQIAAQVLATYNPGSAYVELADWDGVRCPACDDVVAELTACGICGDELCDDCASSCAQCDRTVCGDCLGGCAACGETTCSSCLHECADSGRTVCGACLDDGRCSECLLQRPETDEEKPDHELENTASDDARNSHAAPQCAAVSAVADSPLHP